MDIVERLRKMVGVYIGDADIDDDLNNAADEIERLREALQLIALGDELGVAKQGFANLIAKNALQQKERE